MQHITSFFLLISAMILLTACGGDSKSSVLTKNTDWTPVEQEINGVTMVLVPAGCFMMGSENGVDNEKPAHEQCFDEPFWIDKYEVTQAQFEAFEGEKKSPNVFSGENRPVENITWFEARDFCVKREMRLPTEREWEYSARGVENWQYPWGNEWDGDKVVWAENSNRATAEVGSKPEDASWVGALDLSGNVWEWLSSEYKEYPYNGEDGREDLTIDVKYRALRGGSWVFSDTVFFRASSRSTIVPPASRFGYGGVRCARFVE